MINMFVLFRWLTDFTNLGQSYGHIFVINAHSRQICRKENNEEHVCYDYFNLTMRQTKFSLVYVSTESVSLCKSCKTMTEIQKCCYRSSGYIYVLFVKR